MKRRENKLDTYIVNEATSCISSGYHVTTTAASLIALALLRIAQAYESK